jgi:hypothetical protein
MFTIEYAKDLKWDNAEHTSFTCVVKYAEFDEEHPSGINATDSYAHIQELWAKGNAGVYGEIEEYVAPVFLDTELISTHLTEPTPSENPALSRQELSDKIAQLETIIQQLASEREVQ